MLFNMEHKERLKSIFDFLLKSLETTFDVVGTQLHLVTSKNGEFLGYNFIIKTTQEFDGIEYQQNIKDLESTEEKLYEIFSGNIINKDYKMSNSSNYPNLWVGILLYNLNASHRNGIINAEWEVMVELND